MFLLTNIRSLLNKCDELSVLLLNDNIYIALITETWLKDDIPDCAVSIDGYSIIRSDRNYKKGGGVCAYYKKETAVKNLNITCPFQEIDLLGFTFLKLIFIVLYIPPNLSIHIHSNLNEYLLNTIDTLLYKYPYASPIVCGDLNDFKADEIAKNYSLKNIVKEPTRNSKILDKFFVMKNPSRLYEVDVRTPISSSDHKVIIIKCTKPHIKKIKKVVLDYRKSNLVKPFNTLNSFNWQALYEEQNVDEKVYKLYDFLNAAIKEIPKRTVIMKSNDEPWITPLVKSLISERWAAYKANNFIKYEHLKNKVKVEILKAKREWGQNFKRSKQNVWKLVTKHKDNHSVELLVKQFGSYHSLASEINTYFASNFTNSFAFPTLPFSFESDVVTELEAFEFLEKLNTKKSYSSEGLPLKFIKLSSHVISKPLAHITTHCLQNAHFPSIWKKATVIGIPKSREVNIKNLRPISLRPILSTFLEHLILKRIDPFITNILRNDQFGFRKNCSTTHAHIKMLDLTTQLLESQGVCAVSVVCFDLQKAFDRVSHEILHAKLQSVLPPRFLNIISSALTNRQQQVRVNNCLSSFLPVTSGVPQGSLLSPLIFTLFMNDLHPMKGTHLLKYADDTTFLVPHFLNDESDRVTALVTYMEDWCGINKLKLNKDKTNIMTVKRRNFNLDLSLTRVASLKILGLHVTDKLAWNLHIDTVIARCNRNLYLLRKLKTVLTKKDLIKIYYGLIESLQIYSCPSFLALPQCLSNKLNSVTQRAHKIICGESCKCNVLLSPQERRKQIALKLFYQLQDPNHILHSLMPKRHTYSQKYIMPKCSTTRRLNQFIPQSVMLANSIH